MNASPSLRPPRIEIGIDMEEIDRFSTTADDRTQDLVTRIFTPEEHAYARRCHNGAIGYAQAWCVKEAAVKALWPWMHLDPRRISVVWPEQGAPTISVDGTPLTAHGLTSRTTSSASTKTAVAVVVVFEESLQSRA